MYVRTGWWSFLSCVYRQLANLNVSYLFVYIHNYLLTIHKWPGIIYVVWLAVKECVHTCQFHQIKETWQMQLDHYRKLTLNASKIVDKLNLMIPCKQVTTIVFNSQLRIHVYMLFYLRMHGALHACTHARTHTHTLTYAHVHSRMHTCMYTQTHALQTRV